METSNQNLLDKDLPLFEILNNINLGLYKINNIQNIRVYNKLDADTTIIPVVSNIEDDILTYIDNLPTKPKQAEFTTLDYVALRMSKNGNLINFSLLELIISTSTLENLNDKWDINKPVFYCLEINFQDDLLEESA